MTFDQVVIPSLEQRLGGDFLNPGGADFRNPAKEQDVFDYTEAYGQAPVDAIKRMARVVKRLTDWRALVTLYTGANMMDADSSSQTIGRYLR